MSLRPGDTVEHFVIVSTLGEGGMGQVYLARDTRLQRSIALKIVRADLDSKAEAGDGASNGAARLLREAQSVAALEHPNVVTIYEVGEIKGEGDEAGRPFIAMELVKGKALRALIGDASVPMRERIRWLADAARAGFWRRARQGGARAPRHQARERDGARRRRREGPRLRPREARGVIRAGERVVALTEGGRAADAHRPGVAIGTPYYMAPEQMRREPLDGRADQFAWGVVAYERLSSGAPAWGREVTALELVSEVAERGSDAALGGASRCAAARRRRGDARDVEAKGARFETMEALIEALEDESGALDATLPAAVTSGSAGPRAGAPFAEGDDDLPRLRPRRRAGSWGDRRGGDSRGLAGFAGVERVEARCRVVAGAEPNGEWGCGGVHEAYGVCVTKLGGAGRAIRGAVRARGEYSNT